MSSYCGRRRVCSHLSGRLTIPSHCRKIPLIAALNELLLNTWAKFAGGLVSCAFCQVAASLAETYLHVVAFKFLPCSLLLCNSGIVLSKESPLCRAGFADFVKVICAPFVFDIRMCQRAKKVIENQTALLGKTRT